MVRGVHEVEVRMRENTEIEVTFCVRGEEREVRAMEDNL